MSYQLDKIESIIGHEAVKYLDRIENQKKKEIIKRVLIFVADNFKYEKYSALKIGSSNAEMDEFIKNVDLFSFEKLKLALDLDGIESPDSWLEFARFLVNAQRGEQEACGIVLVQLAKIILFKMIGFYEDKTFLRTFYKVPIRSLLNFFKKYSIVEKEEFSGSKQTRRS